MKKTVAIVGGGPAAMMLAARLDTSRYVVEIYERNAALGRKFLVAGDGGLNLTHAEDFKEFSQRYTPQNFMENILRCFSNADLINWFNEIGIPTFVGTSKRVFPQRPIKPIDVLNAIIQVLQANHVKIHTSQLLTSWEADELVFEGKGSTVTRLRADVVVFALGGGSWKVTGSDGSWLKLFQHKGVHVRPFKASNCAFKVQWPLELIDQVEGHFLKNITVTCGNEIKKGELVITKFGLEGSPLYALSGKIRDQLEFQNEAKIFIDLKPDIAEEEIKERLSQGRRKSWSNHIQDSVKLGHTSMELLKSYLSKDEYTNSEVLASKIKNFPLIITSLAPLDESISTIGGVCLDAIDQDFQLKDHPNHYCIGEMLDWDAPTGGYLLQACFSMGYSLSQHLNSKLY